MSLSNHLRLNQIMVKKTLLKPTGVIKMETYITQSSLIMLGMLAPPILFFTYLRNRQIALKEEKERKNRNRFFYRLRKRLRKNKSGS